MRIELTERLLEGKKSLAYLNDALSHDLEAWERKEYEDVREGTLKQIKDAENGLNFLDSVGN